MTLSQMERMKPVYVVRDRKAEMESQKVQRLGRTAEEKVQETKALEVWTLRKLIDVSIEVFAS